MKKLFILLVILGFGFSLTGCESEHQHTLVQHEAKQVTCTEDGHNAYEECSECDYTTYVKIEASGHKDEDFDHNCDNNCVETLGEHVDTNNDHNCDYGCEQTIGEHVDTNNDHYCDYNCNELLPCSDSNGDFICDLCDMILINKETLQIKIDELLSETDVSINQYIFETDLTHYIYINSMFVHLLLTLDSNPNMYIFNEDNIMYQMYKDSDETYWNRSIMGEARTLNVKVIFTTNYSIVVDGDISLSLCTISTFDGYQFLKFTDPNGNNFGVIFDNEIIVGLLLFDSSNNISDVLSFTYGVIDSEIEAYNLIKKDYEIGYYYDISNQSYCVFNDKALKEVLELVDIEGEKSTIKLMNDIELSTITLSDDITTGLLISKGHITLDLNGYTLDGGDAKYVFIIGEIEIDSLYYLPEVTSCDASFTIIDSSDAQTGKIIGKEVGIKNHGQSLTIDGGTIEISCTEASIASAIESTIGTLTINGGNFIVSSASRNVPPKGIYVRDDCVLYMYGGNLTVTNTGGSSYGISLDSVGYIYGGTIDCETCDIIDGTSTVYLGVNEKTGVGATFVDGLTIWSFMTVEFIDDSITYYDEEGNVLTLEEASTVTTIVMLAEQEEEDNGRE